MILFYLIGWVIFSQSVLMKYLTCCKRKKRLRHDLFTNNLLRGSPWRILATHRGGSYERVENTAAAFKNSVRPNSIYVLD